MPCAPKDIIMKYNPESHRRRSIRLKGYDYTQLGAYFITICAYQRDPIFGEIVNGEMKLSALGEIVREEWLRSAEIRKEIQIFDDEFVIMPNHLHGIVRIIETIGADGVRPTREDGARPNYGTGARRDQDAHRASLRRVPRSLGSFVAGFKASVTSRAGRELNMMGISQRNYYEHIIRNEAEFKNIWDYIDTNPLHWQKDKLHPSASRSEYNQK
jgi:REP element-mobilizing transposase RayT